MMPTSAFEYYAFCIISYGGLAVTLLS